MKILVLGDVMGPSGRKAIKKYFSKIIKDNDIDFTIINGENAADDGKGITKKIAEEFFLLGVDVITSGNHIWDKSETVEFINQRRKTSKTCKFCRWFSWKGYGDLFDKKIKNLKLE